ncbi:nuclear protein MDM1 isoform X3 [Stegostoma tigrinum]|uniref:nuclear protein MDM1 isoform X3 n=1 Tax=Stegostoma tigrinum TaxID=3053191 RepID=UPI0028700D43|nr:nuclear protein MDM1 isoform X3 [Stegostoma tigrinum]
MPLHFKGLSEYKRNFKWNNSQRSHSCSPLTKQKVSWAGMPSEQLGNTREPNFISKKRVPYYSPQASQSFQWDWNNDSNSGSHEPEPKISELMKPQPCVSNERVTEKAQGNQEESETPNAPRKPRVASSWSADCHLHSALEPSLIKDRQSTTVAQKGKEDMSSGKLSGDKAVNNAISYAFKETAPLKSVPQKSLKKSSEYQRQFAWKNRMDNSPLLTAEQIFHSRNKHVRPFKFSKMLNETEYSSQFKGMQPPKGLRFRKDFEGKEALAFHQENVSPVKSTESALKDQGQETKEQHPQDKRLPKQQKPVCSRKGLRKITSEYKTKFRPPCQYDYSRGAYRSEGVKELREKAEAYKRRALGTHFSRDHLTQILSEQNRLWEISSTSDTEETVSDNIEALDLARATKIPNISSTTKQELQSGSVAQMSPQKATAKYNGTGDNDMLDVPTLPVSRKLAWNDEEQKPFVPELLEGNQSQNDETEKEVERNAEVKTVVESGPTPVNTQDVMTVNSESNEHSELESDTGGRVPTPKLKSTSGTWRTHHDLTTPAVGGAVLVSPCKARSPPSHCKRTRPPLGKSYSRYKCVSKSPSKILEKTESLQQSPTAGIKTSDPIPLREEYRSANLNSPSHAKSEPSILTSSKCHPAVNAKSASVTLLPSPSCPHRIQGTLRHPEFQHNENTGVLRTSLLRKPPTDSVAAENEDDRMSQISARSAASSSLASQVLERAQKRRDNFWGVNP